MPKVYKGWNVDVKMGTDSTTIVGQAQSLSAELSANVDPVHGVGNLDPQELKQGPREISGSVERMYGDERLWNGINPEGSTQDYWTLEADHESGERTLVLNGVKFDSWSLDIPQDDFVTESADFTATEMTLSGTDVSVSALGAETEEVDVTSQEEEVLECDECDYTTTKGERALKIHKGVAHQDKDEEEIREEIEGE